ncbi:sulfatase-like hydrolase/transferase [Bdellovibrio bacteriovorus]|uniref:sulfatase-like hydrolase/transferase n=1 Tax=Bdellovibrio bacteriovorus TaxID=959 RepID=UPI0035A70A8E
MTVKLNISRLQSVLLFATITFSLEMLDVIYLFYRVKDIVRFRGLLADTGFTIHLIVIYFFIRVFVLHCLLGALSELYVYVFDFKKRLGVYISLYIYVFIFLTLRTPQIFDEFSTIQTAIVAVRIFKHPWLPMAFANLLGLFLVYKAIILAQSRSRKAYFTIPLICAFFAVLNYSNDAKTEAVLQAGSTSLKQTSHPHIIVITTDSIRGDVNFPAHAKINSSFRKYLQKSFHFQNAISPLPQTHVAMTSILTGKSPHNLHIRTNLSHPAPSGKNILDQGAILDLKNAGFQTTMLMDVMEYSNHRPGRAIDTIKAPVYSVANVFISTFFKSKTIFALFNNPLGHLFLPEIKDNTSFPYAYHVNNFTKKTLDEISKVAQQSESQLLYLHTCSVHWPGIFPYPHYPQDNLDQVTQIPFSYTSKFLTLEQMSAGQWNARSKHNSHIYTKGIDMLVEEYLNPVFAALDKQGFLDNSVVILLSDHGENFWNPASTYPYEKKPEHGGSFLFGADSEKAVLHMSFPQWQGRPILQNVGLIDVAHTLLDYLKVPASSVSERGDGTSVLELLKTASQSEKMYYSETGLWPFRTFNLQFVTTPLTDLAPMLSYDEKHDTLYIQDSHLPAIILQKQRVLNWRDYRYIVYPTFYGFQDFLCHSKNDPQCTMDIKASSPKIATKMKSEMLHYMTADFSGYSRLGPCNTPDLFNENLGSHLESRQWHLLFSASTCINKWHDYRSGFELLKKILKESPESSTVAAKARRLLFTLCSNKIGTENPESLLFIKDEYMKTPEMNPGCAQVLNIELEQSLETFSSEEESQEDSEITITEDFAERRLDFIHLNEIFYLEADSLKRNMILDKMAAHEARESFEQMFKTAQIYQLHFADSHRLKQELDQLYHAEISYKMTLKLTNYYYAYYMSLKRKSENLVFIDAIKRMDEGTLPFSFFYSITGRLQFLTRESESLSLLSFRNLLFKYPYIAGIPVYDIEVSFFKKRLQEFLCKEKKNQQLCISLKRTLREDERHLFIQKAFPPLDDLNEESLRKFAISFKEKFYRDPIYF